MSHPATPLPGIIVALAVAQIIGWGTTFYIPAILAPAMGTSLGLSREVIFFGVTLLFGVGALLGPRFGAAFDRYGARPMMALGSVVAAAALVLLSQAGGLASYVAAWCLIGVASPLMLGNGASIALAQVAPDRARTSLTYMTLMTGFASTIFWPITAWLETRLGWRVTVLLFAGLHLVACLPLHLFALPLRHSGTNHLPTTAPDDAAPRNAVGTPPHAQTPRERQSSPAAADATNGLLWLLGSMLTLQVMISAGLSLHIVALFGDLGLTFALATFAASFTGPGQVGGRVVDLALGRRLSPELGALVAIWLQPLALAGLVLAALSAGGLTTTAAVVFALAYGMSNGVMTIARAALPLHLFGASGYGALLGRLSLPQNLMAALAPVFFAVTVERWGAVATAILAAGIGTLAAALMAVIVVRRNAWRPVTSKG